MGDLIGGARRRVPRAAAGLVSRGDRADLEPRQLDDTAWKQLVETSNRFGRLAQERSAGQQTVVFHPMQTARGDGGADRALPGRDGPRPGQPLPGHRAITPTARVTFGGSDAPAARSHPVLPHQDGARWRPRRFSTPSGSSLLGRRSAPASSASRRMARLISCLLQQLLEQQGFTGYAIVEHDSTRALDVPLPIATRTRAYLGSIGSPAETGALLEISRRAIAS